MLQVQQRLWNEMSAMSEKRVKEAEQRFTELEQEVVRMRALEAQYKSETTLVGLVLCFRALFALLILIFPS